MSTILYVSRAGLPADAPGIRITNNGELLKDLGYHVHYICERQISSSSLEGNYKLASGKGLNDLPDNELHYVNNGMVYSYLRQPSHINKLDVLKNIWEIYSANKSFKRICHYIELEKPKIVILYNDIYGLTKRLIPYCHAKGIKLIADVTEWYEKDTNKKCVERMVVNLTDKRIRQLDSGLNGVIAISEHFKDYYQSKGLKCIQIPPLMPCAYEITPHQQNGPITFVYAGSPGGKDIIIPFIDALVRANKRTMQFRLDIVGLTLDFLTDLKLRADTINYGIVFHGRLPHQQVLEIVSKADFGILFRHNLRYAKAGYSTKFAECMSLGVPMICNLIGGTDRSIDDGINGLTIKDISDNELDALLDRISKLSSKDINGLKRNAWTKAKVLFSPETYETLLSDFLNHL